MIDSPNVRKMAKKFSFDQHNLRDIQLKTQHCGRARDAETLATRVAITPAAISTLAHIAPAIVTHCNDDPGGSPGPGDPFLKNCRPRPDRTT